MASCLQSQPWKVDSAYPQSKLSWSQLHLQALNLIEKSCLSDKVVEGWMDGEGFLALTHSPYVCTHMYMYLYIRVLSLLLFFSLMSCAHDEIILPHLVRQKRDEGSFPTSTLGLSCMLTHMHVYPHRPMPIHMQTCIYPQMENEKN